MEPYLQQHGTVQVVSSPSTPPPNPLQHHQLTQLHHVQVSLTSFGKGKERRTDKGQKVGTDDREIATAVEYFPRLAIKGYSRN